MADESPLETTTNQAEQEMKKKDIWEKARDLVYYAGVSTAATMFGLLTAGALAPMIGGALAIGGMVGGAIKRKSLYEIATTAMKEYSALNIVIYPMIWLGNVTYPILTQIGHYGAAALGATTGVGQAVGGVVARTGYALTAYSGAFVGAFGAAEHMVGNYMNPKGLWKSVSHNFVNRWKQVSLLMAPALSLTANYVHNLAIGIGNYSVSLPTFAVNAAPFSAAMKIWPPGEKKNEKAPAQNPYGMPSPAPA
ncbi:MAG: hypothetical protein KJ709_03030 [Nanoarchaeota archaeon]|nr:hypothetical protein [Nanoarchaeota archaeon]